MDFMSRRFQLKEDDGKGGDACEETRLDIEALVEGEERCYEGCCAG